MVPLAAARGGRRARADAAAVAIIWPIRAAVIASRLQCPGHARRRRVGGRPARAAGTDDAAMRARAPSLIRERVQRACARAKPM
ncbi:hypothetical protein [Lysobacter gummosus]|uniref:hypothetical protein n=1 Tax=Lysobacter gummosus TaxID=262324 RepID=UPI003637CE81